MQWTDKPYILEDTLKEDNYNFLPGTTVCKCVDYNYIPNTTRWFYKLKGSNCSHVDMRHVLNPDVTLSKLCDAKEFAPRNLIKCIKENDAMYLSDEIHNEGLYEKQIRENFEFDTYLEINDG